MIRLFAILAGGCLGFACALILAHSVSTVPEPRAYGPEFADARSPAIIIEKPRPGAAAAQVDPELTREPLTASPAIQPVEAEKPSSTPRPVEAVSLRLQMQRESAVYQLQYAMTQIGCFNGAIDGRWSLAFHARLDALLTMAEVDGEDEKPIDDVAREIRALGSGACVGETLPQTVDTDATAPALREPVVASLPLPQRSKRLAVVPERTLETVPSAPRPLLVQRHPERRDVARVAWPDADDSIAEDDIAVVSEIQPTSADRVDDATLAAVRDTTRAIAASQGADVVGLSPLPGAMIATEMSPALVSGVASDRVAETSDISSSRRQELAALGAPEELVVEPVPVAALSVREEVADGVPLPVRPSAQALAIKARLAAAVAADSAALRSSTSRNAARSPRQSRNGAVRQRRSSPERTVARKPKPASKPVSSWKKNRTKIFQTRR
ncbi:MAG: hypothetical protein AAFZ01_07380 [Pseudomonadota bacterium]